MTSIPNVQLAPDETALLLTAYENWFDEDKFSCEQVADVKTIFQRVFSDASPLLGSVFSDALVMQPDNSDTLYYAMVVHGDNELAFKKACIKTTCFQVLSKAVPFDIFLMMVGTHPIMETEDATLLFDFFNIWKRRYSPEKITRVAQKVTSTKRSVAEFIPRSTATLKRMYNELFWLGFEDRTQPGTGCISAEWIDPEKDGYAPRLFSVMLEGDDDEKEQLTIGVYIHESRGSAAILIETWADWDAWLTDCMQPYSAVTYI